MSRPVLVDLFAEDRAHEALLGPLVRRIAREEGIDVDVRIRSARGGHAQALQEFRDYQKFVEKGAIQGSGPGLLVVAIDGNCATFTRNRAEIERATQPGFQDRLIAACPDPHIERWFVADPDSFHTVRRRARPGGSVQGEPAALPPQHRRHVVSLSIGPSLKRRFHPQKRAF